MTTFSYQIKEFISNGSNGSSKIDWNLRGAWLASLIAVGIQYNFYRNHK